MNMNYKLREKFSPYFDQLDDNYRFQFSSPIGLIADDSYGEREDFDAVAVFEMRHYTDRVYMVVFVSGCSCWPDDDRGRTDVIYCYHKSDVDYALEHPPKTYNNEFRDVYMWRLRDKLQTRGWKASTMIDGED